MTRISAFNSPLLLGFDHLEEMLDRVAKSSSEGYPPYNIEQIGDTRLRIVLAVAGFTSDDLSVTLQNNQLLIRGKQVDEGEHNYLHRGIAMRQFQRSFVIAEGIEIDGASLDNGLLAIDLVRPLQEVRTRTIDIDTPARAQNGDESGDKSGKEIPTSRKVS